MITSNTTPQKNVSSEAIPINPLTIRVGNRGTSPVCIYSINTGTNIAMAINSSKALMMVKNFRGR